MNSRQACRPSCSPIPGRGCFGDHPGDEVVVSLPSPIVEPLYYIVVREIAICNTRYLCRKVSDQTVARGKLDISATKSTLGRTQIEVWPSAICDGRYPLTARGTALTLLRLRTKETTAMRSDCFNGGWGYDGSVPGEVTKTTPSEDRNTWSPTWSASLPRIQLVSPGGWSNKSPGGVIFVPPPPKTGTNL